MNGSHTPIEDLSADRAKVEADLSNEIARLKNEMAGLKAPHPKERARVQQVQQQEETQACNEPRDANRWSIGTGTMLRPGRIGSSTAVGFEPDRLVLRLESNDGHQRVSS